jgi:hypothetical protein
MTGLVSKADVDEYKYIADSIRNSTIWPQFVSEAQLLDVKAWLGDALLLELVAECEACSYSTENEKLLAGGSYTYGSDTYYFQGLRACIIYYAFARFVNRSSVNFTAAGVVIKDSDFSTPATSKDIQRIETEARLTADAIKCEIITFLNRNSDDYPLWSGCSVKNCSNSRPFIVLGD